MPTDNLDEKAVEMLLANNANHRKFNANLLDF